MLQSQTSVFRHHKEYLDLLTQSEAKFAPVIPPEYLSAAPSSLTVIQCLWRVSDGTWIWVYGSRMPKIRKDLF